MAVSFRERVRGRRASPPSPAPPENPVWEIVERIWARTGPVEFPDPYVEGASYVFEALPGLCPNVRVGHRLWSGGLLHYPCVDCGGFPCGVCENEGSERALTAALVGAIFAGRAVNQLNSRRVISSRERTFNSMLGGEGTEVGHHGEGSAVEEARPGHEEEPEAARAEALDPIRYFALDGRIYSIPAEPVRPAAGSIEFFSDIYGQRVRLVSLDGIHQREISLQDAWDALMAVPF